MHAMRTPQALDQAGKNTAARGDGPSAKTNADPGIDASKTARGEEGVVQPLVIDDAFSRTQYLDGAQPRISPDKVEAINPN